MPSPHPTVLGSEIQTSKIIINVHNSKLYINISVAITSTTPALQCGPVSRQMKTSISTTHSPILLTNQDGPTSEDTESGIQQSETLHCGLKIYSLANVQTYKH